MRKWGIIGFLLLAVAFLVSFTKNENEKENLRKIYSRPPSEWPKPAIDASVQWTEIGVLPASPVNEDSLKHLIALGKILFFDTRLSGSRKISCATCHQPELNWTDGKEKSIGHEGASNKRNAPTIQNSWFYKKLFWDGRSNSLEDQAFAPINSESEMHSDMRELPRNLEKIKAYTILFDSAFGDAHINPDRIGEAIAAFERTIISNKTRFDKFLAGDKQAMTNSELRGLHLFRTKARCMNCHNSPLFSDNQFHNNGFARSDKGLYNVTHKDEDMGKMKTPSLRDVLKTGPWMHDGNEKNITHILFLYNEAISQQLDPLIKKLFLNDKEIKDLTGFLKAISAKPENFIRPSMPE